MFRRFDIRGHDGSIYLTRWTLLSLFGFALRLHKIRRPDHDACLHDHPWTFFTLILAGGYVEEMESDGVRHCAFRKPGSLLYRPATFRHRITSLPGSRGFAISLVLMCRKSRSWGFWTNQGFMPWRPFVDSPMSDRVGWCEDRTNA